MDAIAPEASGEREASTDARRFRVVTIVSAIISIPFALVHLMFALTIGTIQSFYTEMGGTLPGATRLIFAMAHNGSLIALLLAVDLAIWFGMYRLARRYWIGLLFAPVFAFMAVTSIFIPLVYLPMFQTITLVK